MRISVISFSYASSVASPRIWSIIYPASYPACAQTSPSFHVPWTPRDFHCSKTSCRTGACHGRARRFCRNGHSFSSLSHPCRSVAQDLVSHIDGRGQRTPIPPMQREGEITSLNTPCICDHRARSIEDAFVRQIRHVSPPCYSQARTVASPRIWSTRSRRRSRSAVSTQTISAEFSGVSGASVM